MTFKIFTTLGPDQEIHSKSSNGTAESSSLLDTNFGKIFKDGATSFGHPAFMSNDTLLADIHALTRLLSR